MVRDSLLNNTNEVVHKDGYKITQASNGPAVADAAVKYCWSLRHDPLTYIKLSHYMAINCAYFCKSSVSALVYTPLKFKKIAGITSTNVTTYLIDW